MKKFVILSIGLLLLLVLVIWLPGSGGKRTAPASSRAAPFASSTKSVPAPPPAAVAAPTAPVAPLASRAGALAMETLQVSNGVALPPATVLDNARVAIHNYCATFGENPVGNNAEITAALRRLDEGRYGVCERCGEPIGEARLEARPAARTCIRCAASPRP